jgi:hypothetical protein
MASRHRQANMEFPSVPDPNRSWGQRTFDSARSLERQSEDRDPNIRYGRASHHRPNPIPSLIASWALGTRPQALPSQQLGDVHTSGVVRRSYSRVSAITENNGPFVGPTDNIYAHIYSSTPAMVSFRVASVRQYNFRIVLTSEQLFGQFLSFERGHADSPTDKHIYLHGFLVVNVVFVFELRAQL